MAKHQDILTSVFTKTEKKAMATSEWLVAPLRLYGPRYRDMDWLLTVPLLLHEILQCQPLQFQKSLLCLQQLFVPFSVDFEQVKKHFDIYMFSSAFFMRLSFVGRLSRQLNSFAYLALDCATLAP